MGHGLFWEKVDKSPGQGPNGDCWVWTGARNPKGYGNTVHEGRFTSAHKVAYMIAVGAVPPRQVVKHSCDNPPCCNPLHLSAGTQASNLQESVSKGRFHSAGRSKPGESNGNAKLTLDQVQSIRERRKEGESAPSLGREFNTSSTNVYRIGKGLLWKA